MMPQPFISVRDLCMDFDDTRVLNNVSFEIPEGEIMGVIGRSGAGKSVLMHLLRGVEQAPTNGSIVYHMAACNHCTFMDVQSRAGSKCPECGGDLVAVDVDLWDEKSDGMKSRVMNRTAIMFQRTFALYGDDRVIENVLHALDDINYPQDQAINRAADLIDQVRLSHRMMHIARDLSGGEKQRVVLARQAGKEPGDALCRRTYWHARPGDRTPGPRDAHRCSKEEHDGNDRYLALLQRDRGDGTPCDTAGQRRDRDYRFPEGCDPSFAKDYHEIEESAPPDFGGTILSARDVSKRYISVDRGVVKAVNQVTFDVARKEIFGIIGKSGAGKTTLSQIIAGIIEPTSGEINVRIGEDWVDMTKPGIEERGRAKEYIGLLHQEYDLYPHRTVIDNLTDSIGLEFPKELAVRKAVITLMMAGFTEEKSREILPRLPGELSDGERHRVALAQVLIKEPRLVILDEPTGTMDPITKQDVKHSILHARDEMDETFIVVSHDMDFVRDICDRVALMRGGKIIQTGKTAGILAQVTDDEKND